MFARSFPRYDETSAPEPARAALARAKQLHGRIPEPLTRYAAAPAVLAAALNGLSQLEHGTLLPLEREVLAMTMGRLNGCRFCVNLHRRLLQAQRAPASLIDALESGSPLAEPRLEALRRFIVATVETHGDVPSEVWSDFLAAGFDHAQALEVVLGVSVYTLTTLANRLTLTSE